jgi:hypothetical protein
MIRLATTLLVAVPFIVGCAADPTDPPDTGAVSQAASVHLKGGRNAAVSFRDLGLALRVSGALSGLGGGDILISLSADADVTSTCTNQGSNPAPGQNPAPLTVTGSQPIPEEEIKNGTVAFNVRTVAPSETIAGAPGCPNPNWTESIDDLAFTSASLTVEQPVGTEVFSLECSFSPPTSDGNVPAGNVTCN